MQISLAKKIFAVGSVAAMAIALMPALASAQVHSAGSNVLSNGTVYFINASGQKQPYTSAGAFLSYGFNSWSGVVAASAEDLALPTGPFVTPADGKLYLDSIDHRTVFLITNGQREGFANPAAFLGLGYSFSRVTTADSSFMTTLAPVNTAAMSHPAGTLVNQDGTIFLMSSTGKMGIPSPAVFNSWGYSFNDVVLANSFDRAIAMSNGVMPTMIPGFLNPLAQGPGNNVVITPSSGISVSLASDNPVANTIVAGQSTADLAHFVFSGSGTVTQLTLNRIGVSSNTLLNNVYLFNGNLRITDGSSVNSSGQIVFNNAGGLFTSPATISVRADILSGTSGQTVGVAVASAMSGTNAISGTPSGNLMQVANPGNIATAVFQANTVAAANVNAGSLNYSVWSAPLSISNRNVLLKGVMFKAIGSAAIDALQNYILYLDGTQIGTASGLTTVNGSNYVVINPSTSVTVNTGSHTLELRADVIKGSARNIQFSLQSAADIMLQDTSFNVNITPNTTNSSTVFSTNQAGLLTINAGTVAVQLDPTFSSTNTVPGGATNVTLGKFLLTGYGEDVQINTLVVTFAGSAIGTNGLNNVALFANGAQVGSNQQITGAGLTATFNLGSSLIVQAGTVTNLSVKADTIDGNNNNITTGTLSASLNASGSNVSNSTGRSSQNVISVPTGSVTGLTLTIGAGGATVSKNAAYTNQTISPNTAGAKIGSFVIQAGNNENIRISNLAVGLTTDGTTVLAGGTNPPLTDLSNLRVSINGGTPSAPIQPQASNNISQNFTITQNGTATVDIWADLGSTDSSSAHVVTTLLPTGTGVTSNTTVVFSTIAGQQITPQSGTLAAPTFTTSNSSSAQFVSAAGGATDATLNNFNFTASSGAVNLSELKFSVLGAVSGTVSSIKVGSISAPVTTAAATTVTTGLANTTDPVTFTMPVAGVASLTVGSIINDATGGSEDMLVTAIPSTTTVTVKRAVDGTSAVSHSNGSAITVYGIADLSGLNIAVPNGQGGIYVNALPTYTTVGANGIASGSLATLALSFEKFTAGLTTTSQAVTPVSANTMNLVGSAPALTVTTTSNAGLLIGENHLMDVTIAANAKGNVQVNTLVFSVSSSGVTGSPTIASPRLAVGSTTITSSSCTPSGATATTDTVTCTFPSNYVINAGSSQTFSLFGTLAGTLGNSGTSSLTTVLGAASTFSWTDITGGGSAVTSANTTYLTNYPTQTWSVHN